MNFVVLATRILACSFRAIAQRCEVDSGFRGGYFRVGYEQRKLVKLFRSLVEIPEEVSKRLNEHLWQTRIDRIPKPREFGYASRRSAESQIRKLAMANKPNSPQPSRSNDDGSGTVSVPVPVVLRSVITKVTPSKILV